MDEEVQTPQYISQVTLPNNETYDIKAKVAEADASGNNIQETYAASLDINNKTLSLKSKNNTTLDSVDLPITDTNIVASTIEIGSASRGNDITADDITDYNAGTSATLITQDYTIPNITGVGELPNLTITPIQVVTQVVGGTMEYLNGVLNLTSLSAQTEQVGSATEWFAGSTPALGSAFIISGVQSFTPNSPTLITYIQRNIPNIDVTPTMVVTDVTEEEEGE